MKKIMKVKDCCGKPNCDCASKAKSKIKATKTSKKKGC